jgi:hypothetical protein
LFVIVFMNNKALSSRYRYTLRASPLHDYVSEQ